MFNNTITSIVLLAMAALRLCGAFVAKSPSISTSSLRPISKISQHCNPLQQQIKSSTSTTIRVSLSAPPPNKRQVSITSSVKITTQSTSSSPPRPLVICGCSGVGKGTLIELLREKFPDEFGFSVSHTTRQPRPGEIDGVHYHFTSIPKIQEEIQDGKFLEYAQVHGNYYGTSLEAVESVQRQGKICILDIDVQGVRNVKESTLEARCVFIAPPSMEELEKRLRGRGTETEESILKRLGNAQMEVDYGLAEGNFDRIFTNDDLDKTLDNMVCQLQEWYPQLA